MELDPEKRLWLPSRRSFFFLGAAAGVGALLSGLPKRKTIQHKFEWWNAHPEPYELAVYKDAFVITTGPQIHVSAIRDFTDTPVLSAASSHE